MLCIDLKVVKRIDEKEVLEQAIFEEYKGIAIQLAFAEQVLNGKLAYLGDISDIPDSALLTYRDIVSFIPVYHWQRASINYKWLTGKADNLNLTATLETLVKLANLSNKMQRKLF